MWFYSLSYNSKVSFELLQEVKIGFFWSFFRIWHLNLNCCFISWLIWNSNVRNTAFLLWKSVILKCRLTSRGHFFLLKKLDWLWFNANLFSFFNSIGIDICKYFGPLLFFKIKARKEDLCGSAHVSKCWIFTAYIFHISAFQSVHFKSLCFLDSLELEGKKSSMMMYKWRTLWDWTSPLSLTFVPFFYLLQYCPFQKLDIWVLVFAGFLISKESDNHMPFTFPNIPQNCKNPEKNNGYLQIRKKCAHWRVYMYKQDWKHCSVSRLRKRHF